MKEVESPLIRATLDALREAATRIDELWNMFTTNDLETDEMSGMIAPHHELPVIAAQISSYADELECQWEVRDHDRYVEWLLTVPADSPIFEIRRARFHQENMDQL